jgi:hypothetical protein
MEKESNEKNDKIEAESKKSPIVTILNDSSCSDVTDENNNFLAQASSEITYFEEFWF